MAFAATALLLFSLPGLAQQSRQILHNHVRPAVSTGQAPLVGSLPATQQLSISIVLPLRNQADLTTLLGRLCDPSSSDYRHFLSVEQFTEQFGPTAADYQAVVDFARANGLTVTDTPANRLLVPVKGTVAQIEKAFHVSMRVYQHPTENRTFFSPDREPSLNLSVPVAHIAGLNNFSIPHAMVTKAAAGQGIGNVTGSGPGGSYLASDMRAAYYGGTALTGSGQAIGLFEFDGYNLSDVNLTFSNAGQSYSVPINNVLLDDATGANISGDDTEEVTDIVQAIGMAPGLSQVRVYMGTNGGDDAIILNTMAAENICKQLSVSWAWSPDDPTTDDAFFQEFAAQGQSLFVASGDKGAYATQVAPFFYPAEDAWVTAVGGTSLITNGAGGSWVSEAAWDTPAIPAGSGGGISPDAIPIPSWQAGVANASNGGSTTLRNVPDVAMEADVDNYYCATLAGTGVSCGAGVGGTSLAAPRWAGFMALVNQQVVAAGTSPTGGLGFINPAIYSISEGPSYGSSLHDIASGNNDCCGQKTFYSAVTGYDLVTGWGSPSGQNLINALAPLPTGPGFTLSAYPGSLTLNPGASGTTAITVTDRDGFTGNVTLAASNLPSGVTASFGTNPTSGTSVLTLTAGSSVVASQYYNVGVTGTSGSLTSTTFVPLTVSGFALGVSPATLTLVQNSSNTATIAVTDVGGFGGTVSLAASGLPSGVTASFGTNPASGSSTLTLTAGTTAALGTATVTISGSSAGVASVTTTFALTVTPPPGFTLVAIPGNLAIANGAPGASIIDVIDVAGFSGGVTLAASGLPSGVTASFGTNPTTGSSVLTLIASPTAALGIVTVTITGTSAGAAPATATLILTITAFTLSDSPGGLIVAQGASGASTITVTGAGGFTGSVTLTASGLPNGVTASFSPNPTTGSSVLTLTASPTAALGLVTVTITGSSAGVPSATTTMALLAAADVGATNEWTWMSGSSTIPTNGGQPGVYGTLGVPAPGNTPGARYIANRWADHGGDLWLFGGYGVDAGGSIGFLNDLWEFSPSTNEWAWVGGSATIPATSDNRGGQPGVYGTLGVPAAGNIPGGREGASSWTDSSGNLWLFGGTGDDADGNSNLLNDLWEFSPSTNQWGWMGGSSTVPGGNSGSGQPGIYGTLGIPAVGNVPGGRWLASSWTDTSGNLWLFGGFGDDANGEQYFLNDLWEFNPSTNQWAWMGGSSTVPTGSGNPGVYGTSRVAAAGSVPGSRTNASSWTDSSGHLWLFGGLGYDANGTQDYLNDLWEFNPSTDQWTWMDGSSAVPCSLCSQPGVYGALGAPSGANLPGGRYMANSWTDGNGNLWLSGGLGWDANANWTILNDLWEFNPSINDWAWMGGSSTTPAYSGNPGIYGTLGVPAPANVPGGHEGASTWTGSGGTLWIFGGQGYDASGNEGYLNDLWKYQPAASTTPASTTTTLTSSQNPSAYGQAVTFAANVTSSAGAPPNGETVTFMNGAAPLGAGTLSGGTASYTTLALPVGTDSITAVYSGDANDAASTSAVLTQSVNKAATIVTVTSSLNPSTFGQSVTLSAAVTPSTATGTVQFLNGSTVLGTVTISGGSAAVSLSSLPVGANSITALYSGDGNDAASASAILSQTVNKAASSVTLASSLNPSTFGQSVTLSAKVTPSTATGTVQFLNGSTVLGTVTISGGSAALSISSLSAGAHSITAAYSSDANDAASTSAILSQTVNKAASSVTLTSSLNPSTFGQSVTLSAAVTPSTATGSVQFLNGSTVLGTVTISGGSAALSISSLSAGAHSITAAYSGDANDAASTSAGLTQTVNKTASSVALASSLNPSAFGQSVTFTATLSPSLATGTVQFLNGSTVLGTVTVSGGSAGLSLSSLSVGAHSITAAYSGDANDAASTSAILTQAVTKAASSVTVTSSLNPSIFGQSVTLSAKVTPNTATGTIQFLNGSTVLGTVTISGGSAALSISSLSAGAHSITAAYSGDANDAAGTSAVLTQTVNKAASSVALTSSKNPSASGQSVTFTATVSPSSATGTVQFLDGSTALGTVTMSGGSAALSISTLPVGANSITAVYSGDSNHLTSTSVVLTQNVTGAACHVTYSVTTQWNNGFGTALTIENTGTTSVNGWNLTWTWAGNQKITESWDSTYSQTSANAKLTNESYNAAIAPGATITGIGFNASYSGTNTAPTAFSLNGTPCK